MLIGAWISDYMRYFVESEMGFGYGKWDLEVSQKIVDF
jgi:hypothetical protein